MKIPKKQKVQPKLYTEVDIERAVRRGVESAAKFNVYLTMGSVLKALHELYGFGAVRCNRLVGRVMEVQFETIVCSELLEEVKQLTGVDLKILEEQTKSGDVEY